MRVHILAWIDYIYRGPNDLRRRAYRSREERSACRPSVPSRSVSTRRSYPRPHSLAADGVPEVLAEADCKGGGEEDVGRYADEDGSHDSTPNLFGQIRRATAGNFS